MSVSSVEFKRLVVYRPSGKTVLAQKSVVGSTVRWIPARGDGVRLDDFGATGMYASACVESICHRIGPEQHVVEINLTTIYSEEERRPLVESGLRGMGFTLNEHCND